MKDVGVVGPGLPREQLLAIMAAVLYSRGGTTDAEAVVQAEDLLDRCRRRSVKFVPQPFWEGAPCGVDTNEYRGPYLRDTTAAEGGYMAGPEPVHCTESGDTPPDTPLIPEHPMGMRDPHACRGREQPYNPMDLALKKGDQ